MTTIAAESITDAGTTQLVLAAVLGIAAVVLLIAWAKWHPFLALISGAGVLGLAAGAAPEAVVDSFTAGLGTTAGGVGVLIALGSMIGALLAESGGADGIVTRIVNGVSGAALPWAMAGVAALIGLPLFFEVGVVLLVPIVLLVARRTDVGLLRLGIPALAGLSVLHGLVPPHPGPLVAIESLQADLGLTLLLGLICAIPTVIVAGPVFGNFIAKRVPLPVPALLATPSSSGGPVSGPSSSGGPVSGPSSSDRPVSGPTGGQDFVDRGDLANPTAPGELVDDQVGPRRNPGFWPAVLTVLLPVVLMLARGIAELLLPEGSALRDALEVLGEPVVALLAGVFVAMYALGKRAGFDRGETSAVLGGALPPIAGILLIVAAGGGFKQVLVDVGVGNVIADAARDANINALLLGFLVAVGIRVATGSATVATITAAGIVAPLATTLDRTDVSLLALAIGAGSLFFSHVNDAGFWMVKEYFGMTVGQTIKTWSVMETIISVVGFACVMSLSLLL
ncbi:gluconate:H+ symporter, GntP family protein [Actinoplanes lobatus]|uniref:Gluconate:H+ symporter, GntP family protein n=1 Tax=Actinoplanes lobatus TaxID=113568 RepID=A0A7W7MHX4_9ACTN|nr:SLC13 family permease [Actinoplanes lobatus]MBB4750826.1 GntP family gluconate:H+ symporter [Actinoplanes lobatus]GGN68431.1 gluconate:H+ symporter, GntP family protein [Actinoplanes lobatus]GIE42269.1 gluconate:H+ symporter, GntP family protein [Actinoplanes lobatus]